MHGNDQKPTKTMKKSEKTHQGLYNVGFIGMRMAKREGVRLPGTEKMPISTLQISEGRR
jgi:hypothetical protein